MRQLVFTLCILATSVCFGQATAVVSGPKEALAGDLVILDASASKGGAFKWLLVNSTKTFLPVDNNTKVVFASNQPGEYVFILVVAAKNSEAVEIKTAEHKVLLKGGDPGPNPNPNPNPNPVPVDDFSTEVTKWAKAVPEVTAVEAKSVANAFTTVVSNIGSYKTIREFSTATSELYVKDLGLDRYLVWKETFFNKLQDKIVELQKAGKVTKVDDLKTVWQSVAQGLGKI